MLNHVYSSHLQAQIQQHAASNTSQNYSVSRYRPSVHGHSNNHHMQQLQQHTHHQYLQHDHENESYSHHGEGLDDIIENHYKIFMKFKSLIYYIFI